MPLIPLYGHHALQTRFRETVGRGVLPGSLLFHGPRGVGKQRLALWLGQLLLCSNDGERPCDSCESCRYALALAHPDLRWFFPRPRLDEAKATSDDVLDDYADAAAERLKHDCLYAPPSGTEGIFVSAVRTLVRLASYSPTVSRRKVFIIGDADRMVPQEGAEAAANAFLKLLEEPPGDTTLILTTSEPGALLPTIRSRVVAIRVPPLPDSDVRDFLADPAVQRALERAGAPSGDEARLRLATGAPGALLGSSAEEKALAAARALLTAASGERAERMRAALSLGSAGARGFFSNVLDSLTVLLHQRAREAVERGDSAAALGAARAIDSVEEAKLRASGNVNPQLLGAALARELMEQLT